MAAARSSSPSLAPPSSSYAPPPPPPPPPPVIAAPFTAFYRPPGMVARLIVENDIKYSKASPRTKEKAIRRKSREISRARALATKKHPEMKKAYDPQYSQYLMGARREIHAYYKHVMASREMSFFTRDDFPLTRPSIEVTSGHAYSEANYEKLLSFITTTRIPRPTATDEEIKAAGFASWKEYVIQAVLKHWRPRVGKADFMLRIRFLPGCVPSYPPQCLPRRSARLARKLMSTDELRWSDNDM